MFDTPFKRPLVNPFEALKYFYAISEVNPLRLIK
jgi:hypothetical protein